MDNIFLDHSSSGYLECLQSPLHLPDNIQHQCLDHAAAFQHSMYIRDAVHLLIFKRTHMWTHHSRTLSIARRTLTQRLPGVSFESHAIGLDHKVASSMAVQHAV